MAGMDINITGIDAVLRKLDSRKLNENAVKALNKFGIRYELDAKTNVPKDESGLASAVFFTPAAIGDPTIKVGCAKYYAAFVEFGTGPWAASYVPTLPKEWKEYALKFFVNGQGHTPAQPFVYPAINKNMPKLIEELKNVLND